MARLLSALDFSTIRNSKGAAKEMTTPSQMVVGWSFGLFGKSERNAAISGSPPFVFGFQETEKATETLDM
jgi:hypothetical protein